MAIFATFEEVELDRLYTEVAKGGAGFNTGIIGSPAGVQQRTVNQYDGLRSFEIQYGGMSQAERLKLEEFFMMKWGRAIGFRFYPPTDREFQNDVIGCVAGGNKTYYLKRNYRDRSRFYQRRIVKPVKGTIVITANGFRVPIYDDAGVPVYPPGSEPTVNNPVTIYWDTGKIVFDNEPPAGSFIRVARGEYDIPVYFDTDKFDALDYGVFADWESVRVIEIPAKQITDEGLEISSLSLAFTSPHSDDYVTGPFDVALTHSGCTDVYLFVGGSFVASDLSAPFSFASVGVPLISGDSFEVLAIGVNDTTGEVVEAAITLNTTPLASGGTIVGDTLPAITLIDASF